MTESINVGDFAHINPIPAAARVGPMVWSSLVPPLVPGSRDIPGGGLGVQAAQVFANMESVLREAQLEWSAVGKIDVWLKDPTDRGGLNDAWLQAFPDPATRPARQVHDGSRTIPPGDALLVATFVAYDGR